MIKTKNKAAYALITILIAAVFAAALGTFARAAEPDADVNGWVVGSNVHTNNGLTEVDGYSSFQLDNGGVTVNDFELDISKEITFAYRDKGTGRSRDATYVTLADSDSLGGWKNMTTVSTAPLEFKLQDAFLTVNRGYTGETAPQMNSVINTTNYITVYIAENAGESYVVFNGEKVMLNSQAVRSAYPSGKAKLFIYSPNARGLEMASPFAPVITSASATRLDLLNGGEQTLTLNYINADGDFTVKAGQYEGGEYTFSSSEVTVTPNGGKGVIELSAAAVKSVNWPSRNAYVSVSNAQGTYKQNLTVISGVAPEFVTANPEFILSRGSIDSGVTVKFTYSDKDTPIITRGLAPIDMTSRDRETLSGEDYSLTSDGGEYTLTISKEYLNADENGTRWYRIETKNGSLEFPVFIGGEGWQTRSGKGSITEGDGGVLNFSLNGYDYAVDGSSIGGAYSRAGRAFYSQPIDVTKPVFIEYGGYSAGGWILFDFNDNPFGIEYCNENRNATPSKIKVLDMVANASEQARWGGSAGFITNQVVGMGQFLNSNNNNVLEIGIGATEEESYFKVNGHDLTKGFRDTGEVTVKQSDFKDGKAYLSIFCGTVTHFKMNSAVNSVAVYYPDGEPTYELKSNKDVAFTVKNASSDLTVSYRGKQLTAGKDYELSGEKLTVKGSYMRTVAFASQITFTLRSHGSSTNVNIPCYSGSGESAAKIADGENAIKYYEGADVTCKFDTAGEEFLNVVDASAEDELPQSDYSFSGGVLTLKAGALSGRESGVYTFYLQTDSSLVPFYVICYGFENGYAAVDGLSVNKDGGVYTVSGGGSLVFKELKDLTSAVKADLTFTEVSGYYETASPGGDANAYVAFKFTDAASGKSAVFRIRPNASDESAYIKSKLWGEIEIIDGSGSSVAQYGTALRLGVTDKHSVTMSLTDGKFVLTVDDEPSLELSADGFGSGKNLLMQVQTVKSSGDRQMKYTLQTEEQSVTPAPAKKKRCGGSLGGASAAVAVAALAAAAIAACAKMRKKQL